MTFGGVGESVIIGKVQQAEADRLLARARGASTSSTPPMYIRKAFRSAVPSKP